jgi:hypothetical protein
VSLPSDYAKSTKRYPVVYVTDAPYAFPITRAIAGRVDRHGVGLESFILVGLSYAKGESGVTSRNRDYTPTDRARDRRATEHVYGQSAAYLSFLEKEVLPLVDSLSPVAESTWATHMAASLDCRPYLITPEYSATTFSEARRFGLIRATLSMLSIDTGKPTATWSARFASTWAEKNDHPARAPTRRTWLR